MIDLYFWTTDNGYKARQGMEESGLAHTLKPVELPKREQFSPEFMKISPGHKIPALVDDDGPGGTVSLFSISQPSAIIDNLRFVVDGEQVNQGIELSAYGEPVPGLRVLGGATFVDAERKRTEGGTFDGKTAIGVPEFQANLNVEYDLPIAPGLTVDGRVVHTGSQYVNAANTVSLDSWTRLDLGARYSLDVSGRPVTLRARVENVTDENDWLSAGGYPGANYLVLGAPRTFVVSASVDF